MVQFFPKYGNSSLKFSISSTVDVYPVLLPTSPAYTDSRVLVERALQNPMSPFVLPASTASVQVGIAINDKTRPVPQEVLLPSLLNYLQNAGFSAENITFFIATGTHSPMNPAEFPLILPREIIKNYRIISHDCDDTSNLVYLGTTTAGTRVLVNTAFYTCGLKILIGNIEPHHFMGFSGGNKTAAIGLTGRETITANHKYLMSDDARAGKFEGNPCRQDVEEIGCMIGADMALNVILSPQREILFCLFGSPVDVIRAGYPLSLHHCQVEVPTAFNLTIASCGGYPKDINLYQAQKALSNAVSITKPGGDILLFAECREGAGSELFLDFMQNIHSPEEVMALFSKQEFAIGAHKAYQLAKQALKYRLHLVSSMPTEMTSRLFFNPVSPENVQAWVDQKIGSAKKIAWIPDAVTTVPYLKENRDG